LYQTKHQFGEWGMNIKKTIGILLVVLFLVSLTAASASAWYNKKGEIISPPETTKKVRAPAPVAVTAPRALGGYGDYGGCGYGRCGYGGWGGCGCGDTCDDKKGCFITAVRAGCFKGDFDLDSWW
jgi:hypothetical protein